VRSLSRELKEVISIARNDDQVVMEGVVENRGGLAKKRVADATHAMSNRVSTIEPSYRYIVRTPGVRGGQARVDGTRIGVHDVIGLLTRDLFDSRANAWPLSVSTPGDPRTEQAKEHASDDHRNREADYP